MSEQVIHVKGFDGLATRLKADLQRLEQRTIIGVRKAAREGRNYMVRETVPKAFGELRESADVRDKKTGADIVFDAPHAGPVEAGSRPHTPPIEPLIAWVKLRGLQGLMSSGRIKQLAGSTTAQHARNIAAAIRSAERGGAVAVDVPEQIARAIQHAISLHGTKPQWFARRALPAIRDYLNKHIPEQLHRPL